MPVDVAKYHMKRCVDSGLWVPNAADLEMGDNEDKDDNESESKTDDKKEKSSEAGTSSSPSKKEEPIYTGVSSDDLD